MAFQSSISNQEIEELFQSSDPMDLVIAARKAVQFGKEYERDLIDLLDHTFYEIRAYSAKSLGQIQANAAVPKLLPLLKDEVEEVRYSTADSLSNFRHEEVINPLLEALADHSRETRRLATYALNQQNGEILFEKIQIWLDSIHDSDYDMENEDAILRIDVARGIMEACSEFQFEWNDKILRQGIENQDLEMKRLAAISIGNTASQKFVSHLLELQYHEDDDLRLGVIYGLTKLEFDNKASVLRSHVDDDYEFIRELLAEYLPKTYFDDLSREIIETYLDDEVPFVRSALAKGLTSPLYFNYLEVLIEDTNPFVRKQAILSIASLGTEEALTILDNYEEEDELVEIALQNSIEDLKSHLNKD